MIKEMYAGVPKNQLYADYRLGPLVGVTLGFSGRLQVLSPPAFA